VLEEDEQRVHDLRLERDEISVPQQPPIDAVDAVGAELVDALGLPAHETVEKRLRNK
jgi:hypothetical protein